MGFYKGVYSPLAGQMFLNATQFFAWGQSCKLVCRGTDKTPQTMTVKDYTMAGILTGVTCACVESPIDFFKSQLQVQVYKAKPEFKTVPECFKIVVTTKGQLA